MGLEEIKRQVENRLEVLDIDSTKLYLKEDIEQLIVTSEGNYIIVLDVLNVNKSLIDKRPTLVSEDMYEEENSKYVIQDGYYLVDGIKGTHTVEQGSTIADKIIDCLTGSSKPKLKVLPWIVFLVKYSRKYYAYALSKTEGVNNTPSFLYVFVDIITLKYKVFAENYKPKGVR